MVLADTLIMHDKATIKFSSETAGILQANYAIVGEKCTITSRGSKGINSDSKALGTSGQNGGNLDITLHFDQLGSLTIDTQGAEVEMARRAETEQKVLMHVLKNDQ